jgi:hypothetical protein
MPRHSETTLAVDRLRLDVAGNGSIRHSTSIRPKTKDSRLIACSESTVSRWLAGDFA